MRDRVSLLFVPLVAVLVSDFDPPALLLKKKKLVPLWRSLLLVFPNDVSSCAPIVSLRLPVMDFVQLLETLSAMLALSLSPIRR